VRPLISVTGDGQRVAASALASRRRCHPERGEGSWSPAARSRRRRSLAAPGMASRRTASS